MAVAPVSRASKPLRDRLIPLLADGRFHSGESLAQNLGVSRTAVWKVLNDLDTLGMEVERIHKRGYRLKVGGTGEQPQLEMLDKATLTRLLSAAVRGRVRHL